MELRVLFSDVKPLSVAYIFGSNPLKGQKRLLNIPEIQTYLREQKLDGWLMADFHARNEVAVSFLGLTRHLTRRSFYFIPTEGAPIALVHNIEQDKFAHLECVKILFSSYSQLEAELGQILEGVKTIAMEYSERGRLPYVAFVDAGTMELVRSFGLKVVSSADIVSYFQARLTVEQIATHRIAAKNLIEIKDATFAYLSESLKKNHKPSEYEVMQFMLREFAQRDLITEFGPNCSFGPNAGNPHYDPTETNSRKLNRNDIVLIDLWAKLKVERAVYADITWMAFAGTAKDIPPEYRKIFATLANARDAAVTFAREHIDSRPVYGFELDNACREVVTKGGFGKQFVHRTGHSITDAIHGTGPNIDNMESEDRRRLQKGHLFSIEPGVYLPTCGFRTEIDVLIGHDGVEITTLPLQTEIHPLL